MHAADVLQSLHVTLHNGGMVGPTSYADDLTLMTCYLAAVSSKPWRWQEFELGAGLEVLRSLFSTLFASYTPIHRFMRKFLPLL